MPISHGVPICLTVGKSPVASREPLITNQPVFAILDQEGAGYPPIGVGTLLVRKDAGQPVCKRPDSLYLRPTVPFPDHIPVAAALPGCRQQHLGPGHPQSPHPAPRLQVDRAGWG